MLVSWSELQANKDNRYTSPLTPWNATYCKIDDIPPPALMTRRAK